MTTSTPQPNSSMAKWFMIAAWCIGIALITYVFADVLERQYNPNQAPQTRSSGGNTEVILQRNRAGHYVANGIINDEAVVFLLDTGATSVSIPAHLAARLQLTPGRTAYAQTANGVVAVSQTQIDSISLGGIQLRNVAANLNPGMQGNEILLGMSFLKQVEFTQKGNTLILRTL